MKVKTIAMIIGVSLAASTAYAANRGEGKITFSGSITDAPCSISPDSVDQTVDLGQISNVELAGGGKSTPKYFSIDLKGCSFGTPAAKNKVAVTFTGAESSELKGLLGITGSAKGAGVALTTGNGQVIKLGESIAAQTLQDGSNALGFSAYLQGAAASSSTGSAAAGSTPSASPTIVPGDFSSVANFTLAYN